MLPLWHTKTSFADKFENKDRFWTYIVLGQYMSFLFYGSAKGEYLMAYVRRRLRKIRLKGFKLPHNFRIKSPFSDNGFNIKELIIKYKYPVLYLVGILAGSICFNFIRYKYETEIISYGKYIFGAVNGTEFEQRQFLAVMFQRIKEVIICLLMVFTPFSKMYGGFIALRYGISISVALSMAITCYKTMGIVIFLMSVLPYGVVLALFICFMIKILETKELNVKNILILILIMLVESLLES